MSDPMSTTSSVETSAVIATADLPAGARARGPSRVTLSRLLPLAGLVGLVVFYWLAAGDRFMSVDNWRNLVQQATVVGIVGFGLTFVIVAGSIDLSVGSVVALSGIVAATVADSSGALAGVAAGVATGGACGVCNGFIFAVMKVPSFIVTLGMLSIARGLTLVYSDIKPKSVIGGYDVLGTAPGIYYVLAGAFAVAFVLFNATSFGRYTRAIGGEERVARLSGVPVTTMKIAIFAFAGVMTGLGGVVLSARLGIATPQAGLGLELTAIAAVVLGGTPLTGGIGNVWNTIVGALIIVVLNNGLVILGVAPEIQQIIQGAILILAVFVALERRKIGVIK
jgi:ribose/xylose/arabinose/galactoside ABC-type transport system permease subunit